ncbi:MAG: S9 family peptidase [Pseudomonadota bacterium]
MTRLTAFGWVDAVAETPDGPLFALNALHQPTDLYRIRRPDNALEQLTAVNAERLSATQFGVYEQFSFAGWNDETVYGFVMRPASTEAGVRYPVAFLIHGGPQGSFADRFHYRWNPQTYAAAGYAVVFIDFHGSTGYGQAFTDSISGDWGGKPLVDLQRGLAAALERYDFLDGERVCALGASYGGFMVNWIAGNWPGRFRCLVNHDGVFDQRMMYYTTEELFFPEWEHGGTYHDASNAHEKFNPVTFVRNWETPMLVIHGALDYRVPETQGIAAFTALQRRGIDSEFLHFPTENHWVLSPANSVAWHEAVQEWLAKYLK